MDKNLDDILSRLHEPAPSAEAKERALNSAMAAFDKKPATFRKRAPSSYLIAKSLVAASLAAIILAVYVVGLPGVAEKTPPAASRNAGNFSDISANIVDSAAGLPSMISTIAYLGGMYLGVMSIFKLTRRRMKVGMVSLGAAVGLLAMPNMFQTMAGSVSGNGTSAAGFQAQQFSPPTAYQGGSPSEAYNDVSNIPLLSQTVAVFCIVLLLGFIAWAIYSYIKARKK